MLKVSRLRKVLSTPLFSGGGHPLPSQIHGLSALFATAHGAQGPNALWDTYGFGIGPLQRAEVTSRLHEGLHAMGHSQDDGRAVLRKTDGAALGEHRSGNLPSLRSHRSALLSPGSTTTAMPALRPSFFTGCELAFRG